MTSSSARKSTVASSERLRNSPRNGLPLFVPKPKYGPKKTPRSVTFDRKADAMTQLPLSTSTSSSNKPNANATHRISWDVHAASSSHCKVPKPDLLVDNTISCPVPLLIHGIDNGSTFAFYTTKSHSDPNDPVACKLCKKAVYMSSARDHIQDCLRKKQAKMQKKKEAKEAKNARLVKERTGACSTNADQAKNSKQPLVLGENDIVGQGTKKGGKKRKADDEEKTPGNRKKRKEDGKDAEAAAAKNTGGKNAKHKGPVDVEKQCGVLLANGGKCARSLTCKSHSMGAKRAVPGRSLPYDVLLGQYQKKSHARQHRAALDATAPLPEDLEISQNVDSDEERDAVMAAIGSYCVPDTLTGAPVMGAPLDPIFPHVPLRRRYNHIRLKEAMRSALDGAEPGTRMFSAPETIAISLPVF